MSKLMFKTWSHKALLMGSLVLGLTQVGCAHPVFVEPSVVVHSRLGHFPVQTQIGMPGQVIYAPPPRVIYVPPPRVVYAPQIYRPAPVWQHGHDRGDGGRWGRRDERRSHGGQGDWRR
jgi:hypothetical protein